MKAAAILGIATLVSCFFLSNSLPQPAKTSNTILIDADTVKFYATFIHSSATVDVDDFVIQFGPGNTGEELLRVPIAAPGECPPEAMIRVTVGLNPPNTDNDPIIGISDGTCINQFILIEDASSTTTNVNPCEVQGGGGGATNGRTGPHGNIIAGTYVMVFDPSHKFGACSSNNGFSTAARFNNQVDVSKGLDLVVSRDSSSEQYTFHYILVEFL